MATDIIGPSGRSPSGPRWPIGSTGAIFVVLGLLLAHFLVLFGAGGLLARSLHLNGRTIYGASPASFVMLLGVFALELALVFGVLMRGVARLGLADVGWREPRGRDLGLGLGGFALCALATVLMLVLLLKSPGAAWTHVAESVLSFTIQQRIFFVLMGLFAAFGEETIFRGILQPTLEHKLGPRAGLFLAALIFAVYHLKFKPAILLGKLAIGLVLGGLRDRTGTLWAPAVAHALIWTVLGTT